MTTAKPWDIPIGALVKPVPEKFAAMMYGHYKLGVVLSRHEYPEDDLAGPICYQVWWGPDAGSEWWMPEELVALT